MLPSRASKSTRAARTDALGPVSLKKYEPWSVSTTAPRNIHPGRDLAESAAPFRSLKCARHFDNRNLEAAHHPRAPLDGPAVGELFDPAL
jgi:hypothetical protein